MALTGGAHLVGVGAEHAVVVGGTEAELLLYLGGELIAVGLAGLLHHTHTAEGVDGSLEGAVGLHAHDDLVVLVDVAGGEAGEGGDGGGVDIQHAAELSFQSEKTLDLLHQGLGAGGSGGQKIRVALVGLVVGLNEITDVDLVLPYAGIESRPIGVLHGRVLLYV